MWPRRAAGPVTTRSHRDVRACRRRGRAGGHCRTPTRPGGVVGRLTRIGRTRPKLSHPLTGRVTGRPGPGGGTGGVTLSFRLGGPGPPAGGSLPVSSTSPGPSLSLSPCGPVAPRAGPGRRRAGPAVPGPRPRAAAPRGPTVTGTSRPGWGRAGPEGTVTVTATVAVARSPSRPGDAGSPGRLGGPSPASGPDAAAIRSQRLPGRGGCRHSAAPPS